MCDTNNEVMKMISAGQQMYDHFYEPMPENKGSWEEMSDEYKAAWERLAEIYDYRDGE
jgi:hypothetical protein